MRLKNSVDYKRFPEPSRGDWTRFTILVLSAIILAKTPSECSQRGFFLFLGLPAQGGPPSLKEKT